MGGPISTKKTLDFSGCFVARDLKVVRCRQHIELMKLCEYSRSVSFFLPFWNIMLIFNILNVKLNFRRNRLTNFISSIARQMGHCMGVNFIIHIWAWSASPSVQVGGL